MQPSKNLDAFFRPRSVAIVGASGREGNPFARPLQFFAENGFEGEVYPVNPRYDELYGRTCYPSLTAIPGPVELALLLIPADAAIEVIAECGRVGVEAVIVFASGFGETGEDGRALEAELVRAARAAGVRFLGPNCQGIIYAPSRLTATFTAAGEAFSDQHTSVAYVGQSGALGGSIYDMAHQMGVPLGAWVSTGNQLDVDVTEVADALVDDPNVTVLMLYVESVRDGGAFQRMLRRAARAGKHVVMLHAGHSEVGQEAVASHTGAMSPPGVALDLVARREGAILVRDVDELVIMGAVLSRGKIPRGRGVGIVTTSGGGGTLVADYCDELGLRLDPLSASTQARLAEMVPDFGSVRNPVDVTAQLANRGEENFYRVCCDVAADDAVDVLLIMITMITGEPARKRAEQIARVYRDVDQPILLAWLASDDRTVEGRRVYRDEGIPVFRSVRPLLRTTELLTQTLDHHEVDICAEPVLDAERLEELFRPWHAECRSIVTEAAGQLLLDEIGIPRPAGELVTDRSEAQRVGAQLGRPLVLKLQSPQLLHKTEHGALALDVSPEAAAESFDGLTATAEQLGVDVEGVLVQEMVASGVELVVGVKRSSSGLPPVLTVGVGGVLVELYRDISQRTLPVTPTEARAMLEELTFWPVLEGYRGKPGIDLEATTEAISRVSAAFGAFEEQLEEFEINPLVAYAPGRGVVAVDCLIRLDEGSVAGDPEDDGGGETVAPDADHPGRGVAMASRAHAG